VGVYGQTADLRSTSLFLTPLLSSGCALLTRQMERSVRRRCGLCNGSLVSTLAFECPRCGLEVCEKRCWSFETLRCKLCLQNEVPIFTADGRWWDRQLGPRFDQDRCRLCLAEPNDADLRTCRKCGRPQCRSCWDMSNGRCVQCNWTLEDVPPRLAQFLLMPEPKASNARGG
jgi:hypothetical protein